MTPGRLAGPRVRLLPAPQELAAAVLRGDDTRVEALLHGLGLLRAADWPHDDTALALQAAAQGPTPTWLVVQADRVVGECGVTGPPDDDGAVPIAYGLAGSARGTGLGTETVAVLAAWLEAQPGVRLVAAEVLPGNEASLRLLVRLGFRESGSHAPHLRLVRPGPGERLPVLRGRRVC